MDLTTRQQEELSKLFASDAYNVVVYRYIKLLPSFVLNSVDDATVLLQLVEKQFNHDNKPLQAEMVQILRDMSKSVFYRGECKRLLFLRSELGKCDDKLDAFISRIAEIIKEEENPKHILVRKLLASDAYCEMRKYYRLMLPKWVIVSNLTEDNLNRLVINLLAAGDRSEEADIMHYLKSLEDKQDDDIQYELTALLTRDKFNLVKTKPFIGPILSSIEHIMTAEQVSSRIRE